MLPRLPHAVFGLFGLFAALTVGCRSTPPVPAPAPPTPQAERAADQLSSDASEPEPAPARRPFTFSSVKDFARSLVENLTGNTPFNAAKSMEDKYFPDERRQGINNLVERSYGKLPPYTDRYAQVAQYDSDWLVRATAVRAVNRSRRAKHTDVLITALKDESDRVRLEAAKALGNIPDAQSVEPLIQLLISPNESPDVRIAAADALRHYRRLDVGRALISTLQGRDFGIAWQANQSLVRLTGRNLGFEESPWLNFVTGPEKPFG